MDFYMREIEGENAILFFSIERESRIVIGKGYNNGVREKSRYAQNLSSHILVRVRIKC